MMKTGFALCSILFGIASCTTGTSITSQQAALSGAVFTTTADGSFVDANIYAAKPDVYLDGGPGNGAPSGAAALPEGDYYFQVTNPNGQTLLSSDDISCRRFRISAAGLIDLVYSGASGCLHAHGLDVDHGAVTVQLLPFLDTPNPGGEYKVWVTPVDAYDATRERTHGFVPADSKTDNFKIRATVTVPVCGDGHVDEGEACDDGNLVNGDGCSSTCTVELPPPPPPPSQCGDGNLDEGEACDDGNLVNGDGCSATCTIELPPSGCCGDGHLDEGEACDDGNMIDGDGCSSTCTVEVPPAPVCGDGHVDAGETCDDGNLVDGDGCSSSCQTESCDTSDHGHGHGNH